MKVHEALSWTPPPAGSAGLVTWDGDVEALIHELEVLPEHVAQDVDLRERFEREARAISSPNHPHICMLHDVHLRERADDGAKLLDFGLAKFTKEAAVPDLSGLSALPTRAQPLTEKGTILGTFQYMAPEQLEGKEADTRTHLFAFGAVLYEMVTRKKAFERGGQIQKSSLSGGVPMKIGDTGRTPFGLVWGGDDVLRWGTGSHGLFEVPADGGVPDPTFSETLASAVTGMFEELPTFVATSSTDSSLQCSRWAARRSRTART